MLLVHFGDAGSVMAGFNSSTVSVLEKALAREPDELGVKILEHIGPPIDAHAFRITHWLRGGALHAIPPRLVWAWINADVEKRARYVASFVAPTFPGEPGAVSARELLIRYGERPDVRHGIIANFFTEMWWGDASHHYTTKLAQALDARASETDENVLLWLTEYEESIRKNIDQAKVREEREQV